MAWKNTVVGLACLLPVAFPPAVAASSLPHIGISTSPRWALSIGPGVSERGSLSLACDAPVGTRGQLGFSLSQELSGGNVYSVRGLFQVVPNSPALPGVSLVGGVWGGQTSLTPGIPLWAPYIGFSLTYDPRPRWFLRLNLGYSLGAPARPSKYTFAGEGPLTGFALGYALNDTLELTLGWNGAGELAGVNWRF